MARGRERDNQADSRGRRTAAQGHPPAGARRGARCVRPDPGCRRCRSVLTITKRGHGPLPKGRSAHFSWRKPAATSGSAWSRGTTRARAWRCSPCGSRRRTAASASGGASCGRCWNGRRQNPPEKVYLFVTDGNDPARALYESMGFAPSGKVDAHPWKPMTNEVEMVRATAPVADNHARSNAMTVQERTGSDAAAA